MNLLELSVQEFDDFLTERVAATLYANMKKSRTPWSKVKPDIRRYWRDAAGHAITMCLLIVGERNAQARAAYIEESPHA